MHNGVSQLNAEVKAPEAEAPNIRTAQNVSRPAR